MNRIEIYTEGLCYRSLCVEKDVTVEELNAFEPESGTRRGWKVSEDTHFKQGQTNPCVCDQNPNRMHYLQSC